jgi:hypothetical protein
MSKTEIRSEILKAGLPSVTVLEKSLLHRQVVEILPVYVVFLGRVRKTHLSRKILISVSQSYEFGDENHILGDEVGDLW